MMGKDIKNYVVVKLSQSQMFQIEVQKLLLSFFYLYAVVHGIKSNILSVLSQNHRITEHLSWKQQIPHEFEADWEYVVSTAMVHQLRAHQYLRQMIASVAGSLSFNRYSLWVLFLLENENNFRNIHYWIFLSKITNINRYCLSIN